AVVIRPRNRSGAIRYPPVTHGEVPLLLPCGGPLLGRRPLRPLLRQQLGRPLDGQLLDTVALAQRRVVLAVGHVRTEATALDQHRLARLRIRSELFQRRGGGLPAPALGLGVDLQRLVQRDVEDLLLAGQRPRIRTLLQVRAVATVLRGDLLTALRVGAHHTRQRQQLQRVLQR